MAAIGRVPNGTGGRLPQPRLLPVNQPAGATGVALVLHGGGGRGTMPVSPTQLSVLRMIPIASRVARADRADIAVFRLLNAVRGFSADPLSNVQWAMEQVRESYAGLPVCLVGHSLGGSVALAAAGEPDVHSVVALAPWLSGSESVRQLAGTPTLIIHGSNDRITSCRASQIYGEKARAAGAPVSFVEVEGGKHSMLRRMRSFDVLAARYVRATLAPAPADDRPRGRRSRLDRLAVAARDQAGDYVI